jgi:hypothetical protein
VHTPDFLDYFFSQMDVVSVETILDNFNCNQFYKGQTRMNPWEDTICQIEFIGKKK